MNNDRFKFRIYDLERKHYLRVIQDETTKAEGFAAFYGKYNNICKCMSFFLCHDVDRWVIEQCTGLKDKNGKLIYEGDVVKIGNGSINGEVMESDLVVEWICKNGSYNLPTWTSDVPDWSHYVEIIGNVHEQVEQKERI